MSMLQAARVTPLEEDMPSAALKEAVVRCLETHQAQHITTITLEQRKDVADYVVVASGTNRRHAQALLEHLLLLCRELNLTYMAPEGWTEGKWMVLDLQSVLVHLFQSEERELYQLESLWM